MSRIRLLDRKIIGKNKPKPVKWPSIVGQPITGGLFMSKYSRELKIIIANEFLSGESSKILSKKYAIFLWSIADCVVSQVIIDRMA